VQGAHAVLEATKKCIASLFTDRAISYREDKDFDHFNIALSVGIQKMVRSDIAVSGVMFTLDTESGFEDAVIINSSWGLGEMVVQGKADPDEFIVYKNTLKEGASVKDGGFEFKYKPIIGRKIGQKQIKMVYTEDGEVSSHGPVKEVPVEIEEQRKYTLTNDEVL